MTFSEYTKLGDIERVRILWEQSILVMNLCDSTRITSLYTLFGFYAEVQMDLEAKKILDIVIFDKGKRLDKYIDEIDIKFPD